MLGRARIEPGRPHNTRKLFPQESPQPVKDTGVGGQIPQFPHLWVRPLRVGIGHGPEIRPESRLSPVLQRVQLGWRPRNHSGALPCFYGRPGVPGNYHPPGSGLESLSDGRCIYTQLSFPPRGHPEKLKRHGTLGKSIHLGEGISYL